MIACLPSLVEASRAIQLGEISPSELVSLCLDNIERREAEIHAWVLIDAEGAHAEARRLEQLARRGEWLGPLHGIPLGVKDIIDVKSWPTQAGSPLRAQHRAGEDAAVVRQLRRSGAILLGKTVTTQFACFDPAETRNPCNLAHTPGGSSSGSAAAVRAEMCLAALGSQTGGSITRPAAYCGVCGLKPTYGQLSMQGVLPVSHSLDHLGTFARTVDDLAVVFDALTGSATRLADLSRSAEAPQLRPVMPYFFERADDALRKCVQAVVDRWGKEPLDLPPNFETVHQQHRRIMALEAADYHRDSFREQADQYADQIRSLIEEGLAVDAAAYRDACQHQAAFCAGLDDWLSPAEIAVTPATPGVAPASLATTGDPSFNSPWSYGRVPTVTLPVGEVAGMPCGIQLIGRRNEDARLLKAARWLAARVAPNVDQTTSSRFGLED